MWPTPDDALFLETICRYFHENGEWPTLRWLEREFLSRRDIDVLVLENRLRRQMNEMDYPHLPWDPGRQIKLTVPMVSLCLTRNIYPNAKDDLDAFITVVRLCVSKYYEGVEPLKIIDSEVRDRFGMSKTMSRKVFLLVELDYNIREDSGSTTNEHGQIATWDFTISRKIRVYRNIQTLEDYLAESAKLKPKPISSGGPTNPGRSSTLYPVSPDMYFAQINATQTPPIVTHSDTASKYEYDVALSFAGPQRELAEQLAAIVKGAGFNVYYDRFYKPESWGKDLTVYLDEIYRKKSRYCVPFFSSEYIERMWTTHERRSAAARMVEERGNEYLLPIMVEHVEVPGIPPSIAYLSLDEHSIDEIGDILIAKLHNQDSTNDSNDTVSEELIQKRQINQLFQHESERAKTILRDRPKGWEYLLMAELLQPKLVLVARELDDIQRGLSFAPSRRMTSKEFLDWARTRLNDYATIAISFETLINQDFPAACGPRDKPGNPIEIKQVVDRLLNNCRNLVSWEMELRSLIPPQPLLHLRQLMQGWTTEILKPLQSIPNQLLAPFQQPNPTGKYRVQVTFERLSNADEVIAELNRLKANPNIWANKH